MTAVGTEQGMRTGIDMGAMTGWEPRRKSDPAPTLTLRPNSRLAIQINSELDSGLSPGSCSSPLTFHDDKGRKTPGTGPGPGRVGGGNSNRIGSASASGSASGNSNRIRGGSAGGQKNNGASG